MGNRRKGESPGIAAVLGDSAVKEVHWAVVEALLVSESARRTRYMRAALLTIRLATSGVKWDERGK